MTRFTVPGFIYHECLDPAATEYPREVGLPSPTRRKVGYGAQFVYELSDEQIEDLIEHALIFGEAISSGVDDPSVGRRVVRWAEKVKADRAG